MRCADLTGTWSELRAWLDASGVTVRVLAGGSLHELTLAAAWPAEYPFDLEQSAVG